jgi:hypothetical protein
MRLYIRLAEVLIPAILAATFLFIWRVERQDRAQLAVELATAKQTLAQTDTRQHDRDSQLLQTLSTLAAEKRSITTPEQILRALPQQIPLPAPITLVESRTIGQPSTKSEQATNSSAKDATNASQSQAAIPATDLKPLYDFALDCKACQAKLAVAQGDLLDEHTKTLTLTKERDAAVRITNGEVPCTESPEQPSG